MKCPGTIFSWLNMTDHQVAQLQSDPQRPLPPPALGVPEDGAGGDLLDLLHPVLGLLAAVAPQLRPGQAAAALQSEAAQAARQQLHLRVHDVDGSCRQKYIRSSFPLGLDGTKIQVKIRQFTYKVFRAER